MTTAEPVQFTEKEQKVFEGIIKYPHMNDTALSTKINVNRTTITSIRNKMQSANLYSRIKIPRLCLEKSEILTIICFRLNLLEITDAKTKDINSLFETPQMIYGIASENMIFAVFLTESYTELYNIEQINTLIDAKYIYETTQYNYPLHSCTIPVFFNYTSLFEKNNPLTKNIPFIEKIKRTNEKENPVQRRHAPLKVTPTEKVILYALTKYPTMTDNQVSEFINAHRSRITQVRNKLLKTDAISSINIPDVNKLGCTETMFTYIKFTPEKKTEKIKAIIEAAQKHLKTIIIIYTQKEAAIISLSKNQNESEKEHAQFTGYLRIHKLPAKTITHFSCTTANSKIKQLNFVSLLRNMLCYD